jgi:hypothetical protein
LPVAYAVVRVLIVLNWVYGAMILGLLGWSILHREWTMMAIGIEVGDQVHTLVIGLQVIAALGLLTVPINLAMLKRMLAIIHTVRVGDPFVAANAYRLHAIAWLLLALQVIGLVIALIGKTVSNPAHPLHLDAGFSPGGWLAVVLTFVLARVFAEGTLMRADLEGTV